MNWDAVAAIGEIVGAVAVVVTLAFLAVQIRQSQRAQRDANTLARSAAIDKAFEQFAEHRRFLAADPQTMRIWMAGCAGEVLEEIEAERFRQLAINYLVAYTNWEQRAVVVDLPAMADMAASLREEDLGLHPGLESVWRWLATRSVPVRPGVPIRSDVGSPEGGVRSSSAGRARAPSAV
jgi:hypothetical protein